MKQTAEYARCVANFATDLPDGKTFQVERIANIYSEDELNQAATCREVRQVRPEGSRRQAIEKAEAEYAKYRAQLSEQPSEAEAA